MSTIGAFFTLATHLEKIENGTSVFCADCPIAGTKYCPMCGSKLEAK